MNLEEARAELKILSDEIDQLAELEALTEEQEERFSALTTGGEFQKAKDRVEALEERARKVEEIRNAAREISTRESGADPLSRAPQRDKKNPFDFSTLPMVAPGTLPADEFRARAHDAIEQAPEYVSADTRQVLAAHADRDDSGEVSAHYLKYGSPEYTDEFFRYLRTGEKGELRTSMSTTSQNGGYLIPFHLDPTIILTNTGSRNPFRAISKVVTITSNVWHGVSSAGVTAEWLAENTEAADASPTFSQPTITPAKAFAYVEASFEVVQDSDIANQIGMAFADAKDRIEATAFVTGNGSGQPAGIVTALGLTTASRVDANTNGQFGLVDVYALVNQLPARYQDNCSWLGHWSVFNSVRRFGEGSVGAGAFWADLGPGIPPQLLGRSAYSTSAMHTSTLGTATASNDDILILGDFSNYVIVDRIGMEVRYSDNVIGSSQRPKGAVGWSAFWRVGADSVNDDAFRMLRI